MASSKELLEAARFHRRRVVAALLTGSPYDAAPGVLRPVVAGVLLAVLVVAGVLVADHLGADSYLSSWQPMPGV